MAAARRIQQTGHSIQQVLFHDDYPVTRLTSLWADTGGASEKIYVVQTSETAILRCILSCTDPGDLVLDPTCGSGTTAYVAEQWGRRWITIDTSRVALALARARIMGARYPFTCWPIPVKASSRKPNHSHRAEFAAGAREYPPWLRL